jgi:2-methylcitrate dehydratase PrpD
MRKGGERLVTRDFVRQLASFPLEEIPESALHEAKRSFLNWLGVAIGASRHPAVDMAIKVAKGLGGSPQATVLGHTTKTDIQFAALINGMSSHIFDFDDTFFDTVLHASAPVYPALLAWSEFKKQPGRLLLQCFVLGVEAEQRIARAICPSHYSRGWHITGTAGALGAAAAVGRMASLTDEKMAYAIGLASSQPTGLREMFGTMTKPFHAGKAAANGLLSVLLAAEGFTSSFESLEGKRGYCRVLSDSPDFSGLESPFGPRWLIMDNCYKPFACGVVTHAAIDGAIRLRARGVKPGQIKSLTVEVHPLVQELTGKISPLTGLEGKFSVYHCVAVGLLEGTAGEWQFSDTRVNDPEVISLRQKISIKINAALEEDQAILNVQLQNGEGEREYVEHARGSKSIPLTDRDLEEKFIELTTPCLKASNPRSIIDQVWQLDGLDTLDDLISLCRASH